MNTNEVFVKSFIKEKRFRYKQEVVNVIFFAAIKTKIYYNVQHIFILLNSENKVLLRLNRKYKLSRKFNFKLFNQRIELFFNKTSRRKTCL